MTSGAPYKLYRGVWPQNVSRLAKYAVRFIEGEWKATVLYDIGSGERYLAVEGGAADLATRINALKIALSGQPGGSFYVNEFRHVIVPVSRDGTSNYYFCDLLPSDFRFEYEGKQVSGRPIRSDGSKMEPGERWVGPRPGIPYVLSAGGGDIHYSTPSLTDTDPPTVKPGTTKKVKLSKILNNEELLRRTLGTLFAIRGHEGGRFYVNEHGAMFTPVDKGDGNGLEYIFCGTINPNAWFPEPLKP